LGDYNAAVDLIGRNLKVRPDKVAVIDDEGAHTYRELARRADRLGSAFRERGLDPGDRVVLCMLDGVDFIAAFLGAMKVGIIPVPINTLFQSADYAYILGDSGAKAAVVSDQTRERIIQAAALADWDGVVMVAGEAAANTVALSALAAAGPGLAEARLTRAEAPAFWLYSSGSTGQPKGVVHRHASLLATADCFARKVIGVRDDDVIYSAAKLFFAYGLGNALTFPMSVGATCVLHADRATPEAVWNLLLTRNITIFCGVPTLFASLLASPHAPKHRPAALRLCTSAGESLPGEVGRAWTERFGTEIVDGIGSTEMLHIFVSNRPGAVRHGVTGVPVPGYEVRLVDDVGQPVPAGEIGELWVKGPTAPIEYWRKPEKTAQTIENGWLRTGDKFRLNESGDLVYCGRSDDMLKVSGIWVSPAEVESALVEHDTVLEAAVVGAVDPNGLMKTKAYVVLKPGVVAEPTLAAGLRAFAKSRLAPYKRPHSIEFVEELPKTATGKIRRHILRDQQTY